MENFIFCAVLLKVFISDSAGYYTEELLSRMPVFTEHHWWLIINNQAYQNRPELLIFDKIVERNTHSQ